MDVDKEPNDVEKFHPTWVDNVLNTVDILLVVIKPTELRPVLRSLMDSPIDVEVFMILVDVFKEI